MNDPRSPGPAVAPDRPPEAGAVDLVRIGLLALAAVQIVLGLWMVVSPGSFFDQVGPFGIRNDHYIGDAATFSLALGVVALVAARRPGWRVPVLAYAVVQYGLHAVNHLVDIGEADPGWAGPVNFANLALATVALAWLLRRALREQAAGR